MSDWHIPAAIIIGVPSAMGLFGFFFAAFETEDFRKGETYMCWFTASGLGLVLSAVISSMSIAA